ncbi:MAG: hypothetical protein A2X08_02325 [Bacteroidetes bacterium GWA2_32_17]|nr:MAG: hypothetical protein A2X08_02325 [Bacteroidetes bacterium GWA2_32_17]
MKKNILEKFCKKLINKNDLFICISAKNKINIDLILNNIYKKVIKNKISQNDVIITNTRHYEAISNARNSLYNVKCGLENNIQSDLLVQDIKEAIHYIGSITGAITTDEVLGNIFKNFCIGT